MGPECDALPPDWLHLRSAAVFDLCLLKTRGLAPPDEMRAHPVRQGLHVTDGLRTHSSLPPQMPFPSTTFASSARLDCPPLSPFIPSPRSRYFFKRLKTVLNRKLHRRLQSGLWPLVGIVSTGDRFRTSIFLSLGQRGQRSEHPPFPTYFCFRAQLDIVDSQNNR